METLKASFSFEHLDDGEEILRRLERYGRTCYKSEDRITPESARKFIAGILKSGHESVIEHEKVTVRVICDRGVTHEIVRHRLAAYSQESTRYCNYKSRGVKVIEPFFYTWRREQGKARRMACRNARCGAALPTTTGGGIDTAGGAERPPELTEDRDRHHVQSAAVAALFSASLLKQGASADAGDHHPNVARISTTDSRNFR